MSISVNVTSCALRNTGRQSGRYRTSRERAAQSRAAGPRAGDKPQVEPLGRPASQPNPLRHLRIDSTTGVEHAHPGQLSGLLGGKAEPLRRFAVGRRDGQHPRVGSGAEYLGEVPGLIGGELDRVSAQCSTPSHRHQPHLAPSAASRALIDMVFIS